MAGGTGGHVFPALAVAEVLRARGHEVAWLGAVRGIENELVPRAGFPLHRLAVAGLRGKGLLALLAAPFRLLRALGQSLDVLRRFDPAVVLGLGGFASGPGGLAAWLTRRPLLVHEQNAVAGYTNRLLARLARRRLCAFPGSLPRAEVVGNPVRAAIADLPEPARRFADRAGPPRLLVLGGSQGARALNRMLAPALARLEMEVAVRHQAGRGLEEARAAYAAAGVGAELCAFIEDMAEAYGWADLVVCRAGAMTVSEIAAAGVAALFVPFPHAVDDHQTANAGYLVAVGAARLVRENELTAERLAEELRALLQDRGQLLAMARRAREKAVTDAAERVAAACLAQAGGAA